MQQQGPAIQAVRSRRKEDHKFKLPQLQTESKVSLVMREGLQKNKVAKGKLLVSLCVLFPLDVVIRRILETNINCCKTASRKRGLQGLPLRAEGRILHKCTAYFILKCHGLVAQWTRSSSGPSASSGAPRLETHECKFDRLNSWLLEKLPNNAHSVCCT